MRKYLGLLEIIIIVTGITLLEILLYSPFAHIEQYVDQLNIIGAYTIYSICYELTVNIIVILILMKYFKLDNLAIKQKLNENHLILFTCLLIFGYNNVYSNTIGLLVDMIEVSPWLTESFEGLIKSPLYALMSLCIFAPVFEEIIYRGIILRVLLKRYNAIVSIIISSVIFAMVHFNIHQGTNALVVGLIIGFIYTRTKSLRLCIFAHFFNNFYVLLEGYYDISIEGFMISRLLLGLAAMIIGFSGFYFGNINTYINKKLAN